MRSLFFKIFLWFWLAMILVVAAAILCLRAWLDPAKEGIRLLARDFRDPAAILAVESYEQGGEPELRQHLERWGGRGGFRGFLFDQSGRELSGQQVPPDVDALAREARESGQGAAQQSRAGLLIASSVMGAEGQSYIYVGRMPPRPPGPERGPFGGAGPPPGPRPEFAPPPVAGIPGPIGFLLSQPRALALILAAVVLMSGLVCYGLARYLTGPLRRLRASARQLAEGDLAVRVGESVHQRRDEMGELGRDFDFMAERIESLVSAQRRLLMDMSHELRSPLARLGVALGLARQNAGEETTPALDRIELEARRLNGLIGQILTVTRLESGAEPLQMEKVELTTLIGAIVTDAEFEARGDQRSVRWTPGPACTVLGTPELLSSAIENVVRNAVRYTAEGSAVEITLNRETREGVSQAVLRVRDHGPGVPDSALENLFRPFYRVGDDRGRQTGGVGLGLAIARQAVRLHGGTISATNALDGGLVMEIRLPALSADAATGT